MASQKNFKKIDENELRKIDDSIDETNSKINDFKDISNSLIAGIWIILKIEYKQITNQLTNIKIKQNITSMQETVKKFLFFIFKDLWIGKNYQ